MKQTNNTILQRTVKYGNRCVQKQQFNSSSNNKPNIYIPTTPFNRLAYNKKDLIKVENKLQNRLK